MTRLAVRNMTRQSVLAILRWILLTALVLLVSAGQWDLPMLWAYLFAYSTSYVTTAFITTRDPDLSRERSRPGPGTQAWDRRWLAIYRFLPFAIWIVAGLDIGRFHWSDTVPLAWQIAGLVGFAASVALAQWAISVNTFFSRWVRIQRDRGHRVVTAGPYRYVRHPGYLGNMLSWLCSGLALGSWLAMVPATVMALLYVIRTAREDRILQEELEGYAAYAEKVRYRLLPGLW